MVTLPRSPEEYFQLVIEAAPTGIVVVDAGGRITLVNAETEKLFGYGRAELLGRPVDMLVPERLRDLHETVRSAYAAQPETRPMGAGRELFGIRKDRTEFPLEIGLSTILSETGERLIMATVVDITERKRAEQRLLEQQEALRISEERYRTLVENANDLVLTLDLEFRFTSANPAVRRLLGYAPDELIGTSLGQYVPAEQLAKHRSMLAQKLEGASETRYEMQVIDKSGRVRTIETSSRLNRDPSGRPVAIHAIARDVTERKQYEEHIALTMRELSHRTKNVLAVVQAMARQVGSRSVGFPEFQARFTGCVQALAYCHDLLVDHDWEGADLHELLKVQLAPFGGLEDRRFVADGPPILLRPQATQLVGLAVHELATNAAKYGALTSPTGAVRIQWARMQESDAVQLSWSERGGPPVSRPVRQGFGHVVLTRMAASLAGEVSIDFPPDGLCWTVVINPEHIRLGGAAGLR